MELPHERMLVRVDGEHGAAVDPFAFTVAPLVPQTSKAHGLTIGALDPRGDRLSTAPVGLPDGSGRNDAMPRSAPTVPERGLFGDGLAAGVVGVA